MSHTAPLLVIIDPCGDGIIDTVKARIDSPTDPKDLLNLKAKGFRRAQDFYPPSAVLEVGAATCTLYRRDSDGCRLAIWPMFATVEVSLPRVEGISNHDSDKLSPLAASRALRSITAELLPRTTWFAQHSAEKADWYLVRLDLARNIRPNPVANFDLLRLIRHPCLRVATRSVMGHSVAQYGKAFEWIIYRVKESESVGASGTSSTPLETCNHDFLRMECRFKTPDILERGVSVHLVEATDGLPLRLKRPEGGYRYAKYRLDYPTLHAILATEIAKLGSIKVVTPKTPTYQSVLCTYGIAYLAEHPEQLAQAVANVSKPTARKIQEGVRTLIIVHRVATLVALAWPAAPKDDQQPEAA